MTQDYWEQRREEILAFRDYVQGFDLAKDVEAGVWLAESGHQLMETAFQLLFLGHEKDAMALAECAIGYYEASLANESGHPEADSRMASVYQRLYYARWWIAGQEPKHVVEHAARAFCVGLAKSIIPENIDIYLRAALLWLEAGEVSSAEPWISLAQESALQGVGFIPDTTLLRRVLNGIVKGEPKNSVCSGLLGTISQTAAWGQPTAGTLWDALQLANIHRRLCDASCNLPSLLLRIR
jgi:hypothetical protein